MTGSVIFLHVSGRLAAVLVSCARCAAIRPATPCHGAHRALTLSPWACAPPWPCRVDRYGAGQEPPPQPLLLGSVLLLCSSAQGDVACPPRLICSAPRLCLSAQGDCGQCDLPLLRRRRLSCLPSCAQQCTPRWQCRRWINTTSITPGRILLLNTCTHATSQHRIGCSTGRG